jgi:O-antigen ligase
MAMMLRSRALQSRGGINLTGPLILLSAVAVALFMGLLINFLPWYFVVGLATAPIVVIGSLANPMIGLVVVLMLVFEAIPKSGVKLPIGGGGLELYDLLLIFLAAVLLLRALINRQQVLQDLGPIRWPLFYLAACTLASAFYVRGYAQNTAALSEGRAAIMWLIVPIITLAVTSSTRLAQFVKAVVGIGLVVALYVTAQSLFDIRIMTGARVEQLDAGANRDVIRSIAGGGIYIVVFSLYLLLNRYFERRLRWYVALPMVVLLLAGIGVQFGRGVWLASAVGLIVSAALLSGWRGVVRMLVVGSLGIALVLVATYAFKPRLAQAIVDRAAGFSAEIESGGSFNWRRLENRAALAAIERRPWTGVGIGGEYKQTVSRVGSFATETTYIHNAYLYFPLKMGLFASFIPLAFIVAFVVTLRQGARRHPDASDRGLVAAIAGAFIVPVITSYTQPEWVAPQGIAAYSILMGLALLYRRFGAGSAAPQTGKEPQRPPR